MRYTSGAGSTDVPGRERAPAASRHPCRKGRGTGERTRAAPGRIDTGPDRLNRRRDAGNGPISRRSGAVAHLPPTPPGRATGRFRPLPANPAEPAKPSTTQERRKRAVEPPQPPPMQRHPGAVGTRHGAAPAAARTQERRHRRPGPNDTQKRDTRT